MKTVLSAFALIMLLVPQASNADEVSRENLVVTSVSKTMERPNGSQWGNATFIVFNDLSWLPGECSSNGVRISSEDPIAVSIALSALMSGKPVFARIETSLISGGYCELVQISVRSQ